MNALLTGGSGDLGEALAGRLAARNDTAIRFDVQPPRDSHGTFVRGSILDRDALAAAVRGVDCVVHIAAWHGIHEHTGSKDAYDFWELNVRGTFEVFEAAARAGVARMVLISSTSVSKPQSVYGHSKILSEEVAAGYASRHGMNVVVLRPRAFIPHWNREVYASFAAWVRWFARGGVHIDDVASAAMRAIDRTAAPGSVPPETYTIDGAYDYTDDDLAHWDAEGPGSTFHKRFGTDYELAVSHGIDPGVKPRILNRADTQSAEKLGYQPRYSLRNALDELREFGAAGPPRLR